MYRNIPMLYRVLESFFRYRTLFLVSVIIITVLPGAYLITRRPTYTASTMIQVVVQDVSEALGETNRQYSWTTVAQQNMNRFTDWMADDSPGGFVDKALQKANLNPPINVDPRAQDPRLAALRKALTVNTVSESVFSITVIWGNPSECERLAKAFQDQYIERTGEDKQTQSVKVVQFLDHELETYVERLRRSEKIVIDFKQKNGGQLPEQVTAIINQLNELKIKENELEITSHNNDLRREFVQNRISHIKPTSIYEQHYTMGPTGPIATIRENPLVLQLNQLQTKRAALIADNWLPTSTRVKALDEQITHVQQTIDTEMKAAETKAAEAKAAETKTTSAQTQKPSEVIMTDNPEWRDLQGQLNTAIIEGNTDQAQLVLLRQRIAEYEARIAKMPDLEQQMNDRMRDFNIVKTQYDDLLKRREAARLKTNLDKVEATSPLHAIGIAYAEPTGGKTKTGMVLGGLAVFGLLLGLGVTYMAEWADPSIRFASDIQRRLGVPALISLPELAPLRLVTASSGEEMSGGRPLLPARNE